MTHHHQGEIRPTLPNESERHQAALTIATAAIGILEDALTGRLPPAPQTYQMIANSLRAAAALIDGGRGHE